MILTVSTFVSLGRRLNSATHNESMIYASSYPTTIEVVMGNKTELNISWPLFFAKRIQLPPQITPEGMTSEEEIYFSSVQPRLDSYFLTRVSPNPFRNNLYVYRSGRVPGSQ